MRDAMALPLGRDGTVREYLPGRPRRHAQSSAGPVIVPGRPSRRAAVVCSAAMARGGPLLRAVYGAGITGSTMCDGCSTSW